MDVQHLLVWRVGFLGVIAWITLKFMRGLYSLVAHPLSRFPGPRIAAATEWYKTWQEVFRGRSWTDTLDDLHNQYGEIVRVGPNELHFSNPNAYHEIYNNTNRWDKDGRLYHCFGEDRSSFGFLTHAEAKPRKDVLAPLFSRKAIVGLQDLVQKHIDRLCDALMANDKLGKSSDMLFGLRCFTLDTITAYSFAKDTHATAAPEFRHPIVVAMDATMPAFVVFRNFEPIRKIVFGMPGWLTRITSPPMAGLVDLQELLGAQVTEVTRNPEVLSKAPHPIVYHRLLDPALNQAAGIPSPGSLYEEAQALMFGGADSAGNTTMIGIFHVLQSPDVHARLKAELKSAWPDLQAVPRLDELEKLSYLTAVIKESLRVAPGVPSPLPRIVPAGGATISDKHIPGGTVVGISPLYVHYSDRIFQDPMRFDPTRWLQADSSGLERWLVAFSKGPRMCLGQNLAMCELYLAFANLFRRFDMELDRTRKSDLDFKECFLPAFTDRHLRAFCKPVTG